MCHKKTHHYGNLEAIKPVSDAITVLPQANVDLFVGKPQILQCVHKLNIAVTWDRIPRVTKLDTNGRTRT